MCRFASVCGLNRLHLATVRSTQLLLIGSNILLLNWRGRPDANWSGSLSSTSPASSRCTQHACGLATEIKCLYLLLPNLSNIIYKTCIDRIYTLDMHVEIVHFRQTKNEKKKGTTARCINWWRSIIINLSMHNSHQDIECMADWGETLDEELRH